ncbi:hypothetical protein PINS_up020061 [Pythium insidiosum]|nr:hypothetical protein PINS_up020061 [Pythium insidiosum]
MEPADIVLTSSPHKTRASRVLLNSVVNVVQLVIFAGIGVYLFGQVVFFSPFYHYSFRHVLGKLWGEPKNNTSGKTVGQPEIIRGNVVFFGVFPLLGSALLMEFLRHVGLRRATASFLFKTTQALRRKPRVFGIASNWSYAEWLFVSLLVAGNAVVYYWSYCRRIKRTTRNAATRKTGASAYLQITGLNAMFNLALLLLPVTRNSAWLELFNISYANAVKYHRWLGMLTVLAALLHCIGYFWSWIRRGIWMQRALPCIGCDISPLATGSGYERWFNVFGEIALLLLLTIAITSLPIVRRLWFNLFYFAHQLFALALVFTAMHWSPIVWWCLPSLVVYAVGRAISSANASVPVQVQQLGVIADDVVKIVFRRARGAAGRFDVGQFVYLNVPSISSLQWHPFTIATSAQADAETFTVLVKAVGDWTSDLVTYAQECEQKHDQLPTIRVDGYYGASLETYRQYETLCLVGGGIGVTPLFAILDDLVASCGDQRRASHSYSSQLRQRVAFIFSFREVALLEEILPVLLRLEELDPQRQHVRFSFYLTQRPSDAVLNREIRATHREITSYDHKTLPDSVAFSQPLGSRFRQTAVAVVAAASAVSIAMALERHGGQFTRRGRARLWPLQPFVEISAIFGLAAFAFVAVWVLRRVVRHRDAVDTRHDMEQEPYHVLQTPETSCSRRTDVSRVSGMGLRTVRDLLRHYGVAVGRRADPQRLMAAALALHEDSSALSLGHARIGVFVSGPDAMKRDVERGIQDLGTQHFELHTEEFHL